MLLGSQVLDGIASGTVDLAFRRWKRPTVKAGGTLKTKVGVLAIEAVDEVGEEALTAAAAKRAGFASRDELLASLVPGKTRSGRGQKDPAAPRTLFRVRFRLAGEDPRIALLGKKPTKAELAELVPKLEGYDRRSKRGAWTRATLEAIRDEPGRRAPELAEAAGVETVAFKRDVRKLKELGLTISLAVGYQLSPRGRAVLAALE